MSVHDARISRGVKAEAKRDGSEREAGRASSHREHGLWSFLTWSFFLSQLLAAQQLIGAAANAAEAADEAQTSSDPSATHALIRQATGSMLETGPAAEEAGPAQEPGTLASDLASPASHLLPGTGLPHELELSLEASGNVSQGGTGFEALSDVTQLAAAEPAAGPGLPGVPPTAVDPSGGDPVIPPVPDPVLPPAPDVIEDVVDNLDPVMEGVVSPLLDTVGELLGTLDPVLASVTEPVLDIVGELTETLDPIIDQVVAPVIEIAGDLLPTLETVGEPIAAPLLASIGGLGEDTGPIGSLIGLASDSLEGALDTEEILASGGSVLLEELPVISDISLDDLFSGGGYTDYGLELQVTVATEPEGGAPDASVSASASPSDTELALQTDLDSPGLIEGTVQALGNNIALPSALEGLGLRGLGDLWG